MNTATGRPLTSAARRLRAAGMTEPEVSSTILIVEDEAEIAELIRFHLDREGIPCQIVGSGRTALEAIRRDPPGLVLLDLMLPDLDGLEVCRRLKWDEATRRVPIIMVTAKGEESDVVTGTELGADDYVTKPFSPRVLVARVRNVLRRSQGERAADPPPNRRKLAGERLIIDADRHAVTVNGEPVDLTVTEFGILSYLAERPGFVRTRDQIIAAVHGSTTVLSRRTVDVHVTALRRKLGEVGSVIETVRGVGYRLGDGSSSG